MTFFLYLKFIFEKCQLDKFVFSNADHNVF